MTRFLQTYCSQCGIALGPGDDGVSRCMDHAPAKRHSTREVLTELVDALHTLLQATKDLQDHHARIKALAAIEKAKGVKV